MSVEDLMSLDCEHWRAIYSDYETVRGAKSEKMKPEKAKELIQLDEWYQKQLPEAMKSRDPCFIQYEELCKLMKWKLTRGKFRPRLQQLVQANSPSDVESASQKAFCALPDVAAAVGSLSKLKAVGPATASAVLAAGRPDAVAFMADESMTALPGMLPLAYTLPACLTYTTKVKDICKKLQKKDPDFDWTPHKVELTLWTWQMARGFGDRFHNVILGPRSTEAKPSVTEMEAEGDSGKPRKRNLPQTDSPNPRTAMTQQKQAKKKK